MYKNILLNFLLLIVNLKSFINPSVYISKHQQQNKNIYKMNFDNIDPDNSTNIYIGSIADYKLIPMGNSTLLDREHENDSISIDSMIGYLSELMKKLNLNLNDKKEELEEFFNNTVDWNKENIIDAVKDKMDDLNLNISKKEMSLLKKKYKDNPKLFQFGNFNKEFIFLTPINKGKFIKMLEYLRTKKLNKNNRKEVIEFIKYCRIYTNYVFVYKIDDDFIYGVVGEVNNGKYIIKGILRNFMINEDATFLEIREKFDNYIILNNNEINEIDYSFILTNVNSIFKRYVYTVSFTEED